ncbi:MAG: hypothetical protein ACR2PA_25065 [Hyphomicrobiaceae bacterium]
MTDTHASQPVVTAITDHIAVSMQARYETLVGELNEMLKQQPGFLSVDTIRHARPRHVEYTGLL